MNIQKTKINRLLGRRLPLGVLAKARGAKAVPNYFYVENLSEEVAELYLSGVTGKYLECSDDGTTWHEITDTMPEIMPGEKLFLRGENESVNGLKVSCTKTFNVGGDITTLLEDAGGVMEGSRNVFTEFVKVGTYGGNLVSAGALVLPATTLAYGQGGKGCYEAMFSACTSLTTAPALPATTLAGMCYIDMFSSCTSLTTAPALPATTLAGMCYEAMFSGCTSLTTAPELPATTLAVMCYKGMFSACTSLTTAPALPATTLADSCYFNMFLSASALSAVTVDAMEVTETHAQGWLVGVASEGTIYTKTGATIYGVPEDWEVVAE